MTSVRESNGQRRLGASIVLVPVLLALLFPAFAAPARASGRNTCYYDVLRAKSPSGGDIDSCLRAQSETFKRTASTPEGARYLYRMGRLQTLLFKRNRRQTYLDQAIDSYRRLIKRYPGSSLADDAQFNIGLIYLNDRKEKVDAYVEFLKVEVEHPGGDMVPKARIKLRELGRSIKSEDDAPSKPVARSATAKQPRPKAQVYPDGIPRVIGLRHWSTSAYTRIVVDLTGPVEFTSHFLRPDTGKDLPARLFIDLKNTRVGNLPKREIEIANAHLRKARLGQNDANTVRVVLDIQDITGHKAFLMHSPERLVIDVIGPENNRPPKEGTKTASLPSQSPPPGSGRPNLPKIHPSVSKKKRVPRGPADSEAGPSQLVKAFGLGVRTVVVDPGHGGKDPGAKTCKQGLVEKDITLKVAFKLAQYLRKKLGLKVIMTRTKDTFVALEERTAIANTSHADLFISIHVNAATNRRLKGVETYFLNLATDERSIQLAARENATTTKSISDLQHILNDLMLNTKINESNRLAFQTQRALMKSIKSSYPTAKSLGVKQAPFYVLLGAQMPAVLVEIGFGTNPTDCRRLASSKYLNRVAEGMSKGLAMFIRQAKAGR